MLSQTMLLTMFQYNHHINTRLLDLAANVTAEQWHAPQEADQYSLRETLFHLLAVEQEWFHLAQHGKPIWRSLPYDQYPDVASLRAFSDQLYQTFLPFFENLTDEKLTSTIHATMPQGVDQSVLIWHMLIHALYHSAQHRSEVASMLTRFGHSPSFIDFNGFAF